MASGSCEVLHAIDLDVEAAPSPVCSGTSGSGKTTLLRSIVDTQIGQAGTVVLAPGAGTLGRRKP